MSEELDLVDWVQLVESVGFVLLVVFESLSASECVVFVLYDVFGYDFERVVDVLEMSVFVVCQQVSCVCCVVEVRCLCFFAML